MGVVGFNTGLADALQSIVEQRIKAKQQEFNNALALKDEERKTNAETRAAEAHAADLADRATTRKLADAEKLQKNYGAGTQIPLDVAKQEYAAGLPVSGGITLPSTPSVGFSALPTSVSDTSTDVLNGGTLPTSAPPSVGKMITTAQPAVNQLEQPTPVYNPVTGSGAHVPTFNTGSAEQQQKAAQQVQLESAAQLVENSGHPSAPLLAGVLRTSGGNPAVMDTVARAMDTWAAPKTPMPPHVAGLVGKTPQWGIENPDGTFSVNGKVEPNFRPPETAGERITITNDLTSKLNAEPVTAERPDPTDQKSNMPLPHGLTPNLVYQAGANYALTNRMPQLGGMMGNNPQAKAQRAAIVNKAGALAAAAGTDFPELQSEYKNASTAVGNLLRIAVATAASSAAAKDSGVLALNQMQRVTNTGIPVVTAVLQSGERHLTGNPEIAQLDVYINAFSREYAKVISGASGSVQGVPVSIAAITDKLLTAAQSPPAFQAAITGMTNDMAIIVKRQAGQIGQTYGALGRFLPMMSGVSSDFGLTPEGATHTAPSKFKSAVK